MTGVVDFAIPYPKEFGNGLRAALGAPRRRRRVVSFSSFWTILVHIDRSFLTVDTSRANFLVRASNA